MQGWRVVHDYPDWLMPIVWRCRRFRSWLPLWWRNQTVRYRGCRPEGAGWANVWTLRHGWVWRYRKP